MMLRRTPLLVLLLALSTVWPLAAAEEKPVFRLRFGQLTPEGDSAFWKAKDELFAGGADDLEDVVYGLDWNYPFGHGLGIQLGGSLFEGSNRRETLEETPFSGSHKTTLRIISGTVLFTFMAPDSWRVRPWVGVGGGLYWWELGEEGDVLDSDLEPFEAELSSDGFELGFSAGAGVDFWIQSNWGLSLDYRLHVVEAKAEKDFEGRGDIDLSGHELAVGFIWTF